MNTVTKITPVLIALAISASLASPAFAEKNDGRSPQQIAQAQACRSAYLDWNADISIAGLSTKPKEAATFKAAADKDMAKGRSLGCGWAQ